MSVWICGNSHAAALKQGLDRIGKTDPEISVFPLGPQKGELSEFSGVRNGSVVPTRDDYAGNLEKFAGKTHFDAADIWGFCIGTHTARLYRRKFWSASEPAPVARRGVRPISAAVVDAVIFNQQRHVFAFFDRLKDAGIPFFAIACPPPRRDNPCFALGTRIETVRYIDTRARSAFRDRLGERGIPFVEPPPETIADDGFLRSQFNKQNQPGDDPDPHHANGEYGELMIRRIIDHLDRIRRP